MSIDHVSQEYKYLRKLPVQYEFFLITTVRISSNEVFMKVILSIYIFYNCNSNSNN